MAGTMIARVPFDGDELLALRGEAPDSTMVVMKPIAERLGLDWGGQHKKLIAHPVLSKGIAITEMPSPGGPQQMVVLPLNRLALWLATISPQRVRDPAIRARILRYQERAADALFHYFFGQAAGAVVAPTKGELARMTAAIVKDALDDFLAPVHASFAELVEKVDAIAAGRVADPSATPTKDYMTALAYLEAKGCPSKGRRAVVNAVSARMMRHSERYGFPIRTTAERGIRLFHLDAWQSWEDASGRAYLSALRDQREGQGRLGLDRKKDGPR